jgi:hypothetical protein
MEFLTNDLIKITSKLKVSIFPSKAKLLNYKKALRIKKNTDINSYGKTLSIKEEDIQQLMNNLIEWFSMVDIKEVKKSKRVKANIEDILPK